MVHQASGKIDLADSLLGNNQKLNQRLDKINHLVDWKPFEMKLNRIYSSPTVRPRGLLHRLYKNRVIWYNMAGC